MRIAVASQAGLADVDTVPLRRTFSISLYTLRTACVTAQRSVRSHHSHFLQDLQEHAALTVTHKTLSDNP